MIFRATMALSAFLILTPPQSNSPAQTLPSGNAAAYIPAYTSDGKLLLPEKYREWIYLSSGIDMSYSEKPSSMGHSMFDNIFVNPEAYKVFISTGEWPDKTTLIMETRVAQDKGSINRQGHYQGNNIAGLEIHVKDEARFRDKWAFFTYDNPKSGDLVPPSASCYSCHQQHAAVDRTFVQFYPTLLDIAKQKGKLSAEYLKESSGSK